MALHGGWRAFGCLRSVLRGRRGRISDDAPHVKQTMSAQYLATLQVWGAGGFGAVIGWYLYFINRYRKGDVHLGDITTVIGAIGGGAVTALFDPHKTVELISPYDLGLAIVFSQIPVGFLARLVGHSKSFTSDCFLDGRRPNPPNGWGYAPEAHQSCARSTLRHGASCFPGGPARTFTFRRLASRNPSACTGRRGTHPPGRREDGNMPVLRI